MNKYEPYRWDMNNTEIMMNIAEQKENSDRDFELLELIYKDLKMRAVDGVVDISDFIWQRLSERVCTPEPPEEDGAAW